MGTRVSSHLYTYNKIIPLRHDDLVYGCEFTNFFESACHDSTLQEQVPLLYFLLEGTVLRSGECGKKCVIKTHTKMDASMFYGTASKCFYILAFKKNCHAVIVINS